ncbi:MAG: PilZ domain-containing protein [Chloroflexi bacterium]|nr:PilZ domain-containing protein [Chloroflexota bacterium]
MPQASKPPKSTTQRRSAVRQQVAVVPRLARILYGGVAQRPIRVGVIDVSATGLNVRSQDELRVGDLLELVLDLDGEVQLHARVTRIHRHERFWSAGCAFVGVNERLAEQIVKYVFVQQRHMLRKLRGAQ